MRRILTVITSIALTFALSFSAAFASDDALVKSQNYLKTITLDSPDAVIAYEAAGFEADGKADSLLENFKDVDYTTASYGDLAKSIIAISLLGDNPADFNKTNLVEILENKVQADGTLTEDKNGGCGATIWTLMALETVNSDKTKTVADKLSTMAMDNGAYWYEYQGPNADLDTTGWAMEALSVAGRSTYDAAISKAYTFVQSKLNSKDGSYDIGWGGNADTQSCVLEGLHVAGYKLDDQAYNYLLSYQNEDGTFNALNYNTYQLEPNAYASLEGARALGVINNGSFVLKARKDYIKECIKYYEYKEKQRPIIEANKEFEKKKRKFLQEVKMSKEAPTKKQLYYYDRLCKKYSIEKKDVEELSKLDLRNEIESILNEHSDDYKNVD